jgi:hypothetical protein
MAMCRDYPSSFGIAICAARYIIKKVKVQALDIMLWAEVSEKDVLPLLKEIQSWYPFETVWAESKTLRQQYDLLIFNVKANPD